MLCIGKKSVKAGAATLCARSVKPADPGICLTFAPWLRYQCPTVTYRKDLCSLSVVWILIVVFCFRWVICLTILVQCSLVCSCPSGLSPSWSTGNARTLHWHITGTAWTFMKRRCGIESCLECLGQIIHLFLINVWLF